MDAQQQNFISRLLEISDRLLDISYEADRLIGEYFLNSHSAIDNADLADIPAFAHLTETELLACVASLQALQTHFGDYSSGNRINYVRMRG